MAGDWVDVFGEPLEGRRNVTPGQLELAISIEPQFGSARPAPARCWRSSMAPNELDDLGSFDYGKHSGIFLGRTGLGPLRVGCDTNVLIDILDHGHRVLDDLERADEGDGLPVIADDEEITALLEILRLWTCRDIRLVFSERQAKDHRAKGVGRLDINDRHGEILELNAGWAHVVPDDPAGQRGGGLPDLAGMPPNTDTELVAIAIRSGCHVFLTRDRPVAARAPRLRPFGIAVMRPTDLLGELAAGGDLGLVGADGGVCDNHKVVHLERVASRQ